MQSRRNRHFCRDVAFQVEEAPQWPNLNRRSWKRKMTLSQANASKNPTNILTSQSGSTSGIA
ncbi:hypothetical protein HN51_041157, partial [Arachis hypogaea]